MKLEVLNCFEDAVANKMRQVGEVFEADEARAKELLAHPLHLVKAVENAFETADKKPVVKKAKKPAAKKAAAKKPAANK